jgi:hypothetical protein
MRTSLYAILCIVIRLGAVFLAFDMLVLIPGTVAEWRAGTHTSDMTFALGFMAIALVFALALWIYPGILARIVAGKNSREVFESPIEPAELQWIALSVLGTYFVLRALIALSTYGVRWAMFASLFNGSQESQTKLISDMSYYIIQLVLGTGLVLGARGLTQLLRRLRYGDAARSPLVESAD